MRSVDPDLGRNSRYDTLKLFLEDFFGNDDFEQNQMSFCVMYSIGGFSFRQGGGG